MYRHFFKRFLDIVLSLMAIIILSPFYIIIALKKHFWIAGGLVVVGFLLNWSSECFAFSLISNNEMCGKRTIRVMAWNIDGSEYDSLKVARIADVINKYKPDVVFLSEDFDKTR